MRAACWTSWLPRGSTSPWTTSALGYASLSWLQQLPFNALKIDRSFVADLTAGGVGVDLVRCTIELAHVMGKVVVAEGVETQEQASILRGLHCAQAQGFLYARPLPACDARPQLPATAELRSWLDAVERGWADQLAALKAHVERS